MLREIRGYQVCSLIHENINSEVYRGRRGFDDLPVILKVLKTNYPSLEKITRYKQEYEITHSLREDNIIKAYDFQEIDNKFIIVFEDFQAESLARVLKKKSLSLKEILAIVIEIVVGLERIHAANIIHKDINPANIVLNQATKQLKIIDFGISTKLKQEQINFLNTTYLEGTLAYIAPEQTGRINRAIDYRSDYYSLGATFYQLLTNRSLFSVSEPLEIIYNHLANIPEPPHLIDPKIPLPISNIVMKLLAKMPEDRYQTSWGIKADLEKCLQQLEENQTILDFPIGERDISPNLQISQKLYGRETEKEKILSSFTRVTKPKKSSIEIVLVSGCPGIGKSALIKEIFQEITRQKSYFIAGKFEQYQREIPYSALALALDRFCEQLLTETDTQLNKLRQKLLDILGENIGVITDFIPRLKPAIGEIVKPPELPANEHKNRFNFVLQQFIKIFSQSDRPLVIFLDDLQWSDSASLELIQQLVTKTEDLYLLIIGTYRDNEITPAHPLSLTLENIERSGIYLSKIKLLPLELNSINQLLADSLSLELDKTLDLAKLILAKTAGNPFFVNEFIQALERDRLLEFDREKQTWQWSNAAIKSRDITENVVELMINKIQLLDYLTQQSLHFAACLGNQFDLKTLAIVTQNSPQTTALLLHLALELNLIYPLNNLYKSIELGLDLSPECNVKYKFAHDRIQEAAYTLNSASNREKNHWQIGQFLLKNTFKTESKIFEIVNQLNLGIKLAKSPREKYAIASLNLQAAIKAKSAAAYSTAFNYAKLGLDILPENSWEKEYKISLYLYNIAAESAYLCGNFPGMEAYLNRVLKYALNPLDRVKAYEVKIQACIGENKLKESLKLSLEILSQLEIKISPHPSKLNILWDLLKTKWVLINKNTSDLYLLKPTSDPQIRAGMEIMTQAICTVYLSQPDLLPLLVTKMIRLSVKYGNSQVSAFGYALYGLMLSSFFTNIKQGYEFGELALKLLEKYNSISIKAKTIFAVNAGIKIWKEPIQGILKSLEKAYIIGVNNGDLEYASYAAVNLCYLAYHSGQPLNKVTKTIEKYLDFFNKSGRKVQAICLEIYLQSTINLTKKEGSYVEIQGDIFDESKTLAELQKQNDRHDLFHLFLNKIILCYLFKDFDRALTATKNAEQYLDGVTGQAVIAIFYFYDSLVKLQSYLKASKSNKKKLIKQIISNLKKLKKWSKYGAENYLHKYHLVLAEKYRILGKENKAIAAYEDSIRLARENKYTQEEALANELTAQFYLDRGKIIVAKAYIQESIYCYSRWGAVAKVRQIESKYIELIEPQLEIKTKAINLDSNESVSLTKLDWLSIIKASQALSGTIILEELLTKLMKILIENTGASRGALLWSQDGQSSLELLDNWQIVSFDGGNNERNKSASQNINSSFNLPRNILSDVINSHQTLVSDRDFEIPSKSSKSAVCLPILNQNRLLGLLYLENDLLSGVFNERRLEFLEVISAQIAISLDNALLYQKLQQSNQQLQEYSQTLENKVAQRTKELSLAKDAAEVANRAKSTFLSQMSHELRTPLNAILGFTQLMQRDSNLNKQQKEYLAIVNRNGEHLLKLINEVLDISKIEAGKMILAETDFDLYQLLNDLSPIFALEIQKKQLQLIVQRSPNLPRSIRADRSKLEQILINLLSNAVKFTKRGSITLKASTEETQILKFSVEDTGVGIAPEEIDKLFEPFSQTESGLKSQQGTGLGLAICKHSIELMGGEIKIESIRNKGTKVFFWLPYQTSNLILPKRSDLSCDPILKLSPDRPIYKILVAEDRLENSYLLIELLTNLDFEVRSAENGSVAFEIWQNWSPHLILMDLQMPVMDGYETIKKIRATPQQDTTKIIVLTAEALETERLKNIEPHYNDLILKPYRQETLLAKIASQLEIEYTYSSQTEILPEQITPDRLKIMPQEWIERLYQLACQLDRDSIFNLIEQIPPEEATLAKALSDLVSDFNFEEIIELTQLD